MAHRSRVPAPLAVASACAAFVLTAFVSAAFGAVEPYAWHDLAPSHDTWATHDDGVVHGHDEFIRVGLEPQECDPADADSCPDASPECCVVPDGYNYCAPAGQCAGTTPSWTSTRKFRGYVRFDLSGVTEGRVVQAYLSFKPLRTVAIMGGPVDVQVYRLSSIGEPEVCAWNEATLDDTDRTRWSSLPQNVSLTPDGRWRFDVTKAVRDWLEGDTDQSGAPIQPNCGFHLAEPNFVRAEHPLARWVDFESKEGNAPPQLSIQMALDVDDDGHFADCDEEDPAIHPAAVETCDGEDDDCDGLTDEENCDGVDNDCDGLTDEGDPATLCGPGRVCVAHACVDACYDECAGPYDVACGLAEGGTGWERLGCGHVDDDPCLDRFVASKCGDFAFCQYGSCSYNCVDDCDPEEEDTKSCREDELGRWSVARCTDGDGDGCREWVTEEPCLPAATCADATCAGGCTDACLTLGAADCADETTVRVCYDQDRDGCLDLVETETCAAPDAVCEDGLCVPVVTCEDECAAGAQRCVDDGGAAPAQRFTCLLRADAPCYAWADATPCPYGCSADGLDCAPAPPAELEPHPDVVGPGPDGGAPTDDAGSGTEDAGPETAGSPDAAGGPDAGGPGTDVASDTGGSGAGDGVLSLDGLAADSAGGGGGAGGGSSGCQTSPDGPGGAGAGGGPSGLLPLVLLLLLAGLAVRRRRRSA